MFLHSHVASRWSKLEAARRWLTITRLANCMDEWFGPVMGRMADLAQAATDSRRKWIKGTKAAQRVFK